MPQDASDSANDDYFNDLSQQPGQEQNSGPQPNGRTNSNDGQKDGDAASKIKRIACVLCRKRKLRCDGARPTCGTCKRLTHECAYDEVRKKSGPKRGYVKLLEARLQQVETLLKSQETTDPQRDAPRHSMDTAFTVSGMQSIPDAFLGNPDSLQGSFPESLSPSEGFPVLHTNPSTGPASGEEYPWEMIGLGLDEPLPPQEVINELHQIYFMKIHPSLPIIHRPRYFAAMNLAPHMRPPVCLRYIMWCLASSISDKYEALQEHFYQRARKYVQMDEMKGHGESIITIAHCQTWILCGTYEFKQMFFPRAWLSSGRASRLAQMMQLHRLDGAGLDVKQCLPPPRDWTEREERRRTFWMAFCVDRYASIGTGWPMSIDEKDIMTNLPATEEAFEKSKPMVTGSLDQAMTSVGAAAMSPLGGIALTAALFGRNLLHLHRPTAEDRDEDLNGEFWARHRKLENILLSTSLGLPEHLRLPGGLPDPNVIFLNMNIHTSAICLHQAAIFKAEKYRLSASISNESKIRCVAAAAEIAMTMRTISHLDLATMSPFISFCVYVAARVFVQYLKTRPNDQQMISSLQFLLQAMQALRRRNPLTESFLVQLDLDLESAGVTALNPKPYFNPPSTSPATVPAGTDAGCNTIFDIRDSQNANARMNTFGNGGIGGHGAPQGSVPPPGGAHGASFHARTNVNLDLNPTGYSYLPAPHEAQIELPRRTKGPASLPPGMSGLPMGISQPPSAHACDQTPAESDMDTSPDASVDQPTPSTSHSQSHRGSSSNASSFTPPQQDDSQNPQAANRTQQRNGSTSRNPMNQFPEMPQYPPTRTNSSMETNAFFPGTTSDLFNPNLDGLGPNFFSPDHPSNVGRNDPTSGGFIMGNEWELPVSGIDMSSDMRPMSNSGFNSLMENIQIGWQNVGPPHPGSWEFKKP